MRRFFATLRTNGSFRFTFSFIAEEMYTATLLAICVLALLLPTQAAKLSRHKIRMPPVFFQTGILSEQELSQCAPEQVCNKVDTYASPWIEKQCLCPGTQACSMSLDSADGYTIPDKSRQFKVCSSVNKLPTCRYFRDITWTLTSGSNNQTSQTVHCICPKGSVAYIVQHEPIETETGSGYKYHFACSPESRLRCERKEPCRLFTVRKRVDGVQDVNTNLLCQCSRGQSCPTHHIDRYVVPGVSYPEDRVKTFTAFCSPGSPSLPEPHK